MTRPPARARLLRIGGCASLVLAIGTAGVALAPDFVRAGPGESSPSAEGAAVEAAECRAAEPLPSAASVMDRVVEQLRAERAAAGGDADDVVVLNGRGYNYGPPPGIRADSLVPRGPTRPR